MSLPIKIKENNNKKNNTLDHLIAIVTECCGKNKEEHHPVRQMSKCEGTVLKMEIINFKLEAPHITLQWLSSHRKLSFSHLQFNYRKRIWIKINKRKDI